MNDQNRTVTIDNIDYNFDDLPDKAKQDLLSLQLVDQKITEKQQELAIFQTARNAYAKSLQEQVPQKVQ